MGYLGKEQEQAIARSTRYLVAALLTTLMIFIAGLFLSAELEQQAVQKDETKQQIALHRRSNFQPSGHGLCGEGTLMRKHEPSSAAASWIGARQLSRRMAQQAHLKSQSKAKTLAVLSKQNHTPQHHPIHVAAQLLASETTACTEVTSPLSEVQINRSIEVITLEAKHPAYHLPLKLSSSLLSDRFNEWGKGSAA